MQRKEAIGRLDRRITIQAVSETRTATGSASKTWADWQTVWASVSYSLAGSDETEQLAQQNSVERVTFKIRYLKGLSAKHRICYDGELYDILHIQEDGRRHFLNIVTEQREK